MKNSIVEDQRDCSGNACVGCHLGELFSRYAELFLVGATMLTVVGSAIILRSSIVSAEDVIDNVAITVESSCSMSGNINTAHTANLKNSTYSGAEGSTYENGIGKTTLTAFCNDMNGFSIYAIGFTGDVAGNTNLVGANNGSFIPTGTAISGDTSNWAMKVTKVDNPGGQQPDVTYNPENMTITNSFNNFHAVPDTYTKVAEYHAETGSSATDQGPGALGAKLETTYATYVSADQYADTYTGQVKYVMVHPYDAAAPEIPVSTLYDNVASMSKGKQTATTLRADITVPTSADRTQDASNSGVYEYDPDAFGASSDASNNNKIYYYRGVLENSPGTYGSDGSAVTYPNYVKLGNTCWRIVRTTGSGGVKMIYNGLYGATTAGSCANTENNAQVATSAFNGTTSTYRQIVRVGYTYNSTYAVNTSKSGTIAQIFGSNSNPGANNTRSDIKTYIEDTWYTGTNGVSAYTNMLEPSASYCNDRTMNTTDNWTTPLAESTTIASTYGTSGQQTYYFGARPRTASTAQLPSLTCGNKYNQIDRSVVDLYRYNGTNGTAGSTTANYLKYPAALLTADEAALAGSGYGSSTTPYHNNSFLHSGSVFWLLSPGYRGSSGSALGFRLRSNGYLDDYYVHFAYGVRPAISLKFGTTAASGSGTATDPWIVNPPSS